MGFFKTIKKGFSRSYGSEKEAHLKQQYEAEKLRTEAEYNRLKKQKKLTQMQKEIREMRQERFKSQHPVISGALDDLKKGVVQEFNQPQDKKKKKDVPQTPFGGGGLKW